MKAEDELVLPRWAPWLVLLPLGVLFADLLLNHFIGWRDEVTQVTSTIADERAEATGRSRALAAILPFMLIAVLIALNFAREFATVFGPRMRRRLLMPILLFAVSAVALIVAQMNGFAPPEEAIGKNFIDKAFSRQTAAGIPLATALDILVMIFRVALTLGAGAVIIGTIACLGSPGPSLPPAKKKRIRDVQRRRLDIHLYASALLLVSGMFFIDSVFRWPAPFSTAPEQYEAHINALMLADGILYSTIIASYYVPVALWIRYLAADGPEPARRGAARASPSEESPGPASADALSPGRLIRTFLALIAPALAGVLSQFLDAAGVS